MGYQFQSDDLLSYLKHDPPGEAWRRIPMFTLRLASELSEQVRGMDFLEANGENDVSVRMFNRNLAEICLFVDWTEAIWNQELRKEYRSRYLSLDELVNDVQLRDGSSARESVLGLFESWHQVTDNPYVPYLSIAKYPSQEIADEPFATIGNVCAAFGLAILDRLLVSLACSDKESALADLSAAWNFASVARWSNHMDMAVHFNVAGYKEKMSRAARARHSKDPKQLVKRKVQELWQRWSKEPPSYPSIAAFARSMVDKWPDQLSSEIVVARWVRQWRRQG